MDWVKVNKDRKRKKTSIACKVESVENKICTTLSGTDYWKNCTGALNLL